MHLDNHALFSLHLMKSPTGDRGRLQALKMAFGGLTSLERGSSQQAVSSRIAPRSSWYGRRLKTSSRKTL